MDSPRSRFDELLRFRLAAMRSLILTAVVAVMYVVAAVALVADFTRPVPPKTANGNEVLFVSPLR